MMLWRCSGSRAGPPKPDLTERTNPELLIESGAAPVRFGRWSWSWR